MRAHLPEGILVAVAGGKTLNDPGAVSRSLDKARAKYPDLVLVHSGGPGVEKIAAEWAERHAYTRSSANRTECPWTGRTHGKCSTELIPLLPRDGVDRDFLPHLLRRCETVDLVMAAVTGSRELPEEAGKAASLFRGTARPPTRVLEGGFWCKDESGLRVFMRAILSSSRTCRASGRRLQ